MLINGDYKVVKVINRFLMGESVPENVLNALDEICKQYGFTAGRSFIRMINTDDFVVLHDTSIDKTPVMHSGYNGVDLVRSHYRRDYTLSSEILEKMLNERFIHTKDFSKYKTELEKLGYTETEYGAPKEACIWCVSVKEEGILGFFVFEKHDKVEFLLENETEQIKSLCTIINQRIESFELSKQLKEEELHNVIDALTELPMLSIFKTKAEEMLLKDDKYAMFYIDVDKFKYINEIWSFDIGNEILIEVSNVLKRFSKDIGICCRISDDKFAAMIQYKEQEDILELQSKLNKMFVNMQQQLFSDIKITVIGGVYPIINREESISLIIDKANIARRATKGSYKNVFKMYNQNLENESEREKDLEQKMLTALEKGEFVPFLQPKFDLVTNEICGAEALVRWKTSERMISPAEFIPVFEKNGFITRLDFVVYEEVFKFINKCLLKGYTLQTISLNVSRVHMNNENFLKDLIGKMDLYDVPRNLIELEITESVFMEDKTVLQKFIKEIRDQKIIVSIDDFGTAYSSLNLLKDIVVDVIKIDKSFIDNINDKNDVESVQKDKVIIKNIINMVNELEFKTIFEGIETQEHVDFLKEIGCQSGQGYIFARPMSLEEFENTYLKK